MYWSKNSRLRWDSKTMAKVWRACGGWIWNTHELVESTRCEIGCASTASRMSSWINKKQKNSIEMCISTREQTELEMFGLLYWMKGQFTYEQYQQEVKKLLKNWRNCSIEAASHQEVPNQRTKTKKKEIKICTNKKTNLCCVFCFWVKKKILILEVPVKKGPHLRRNMSRSLNWLSIGWKHYEYYRNTSDILHKRSMASIWKIK
jgi:hypothetical protein